MWGFAFGARESEPQETEQRRSRVSASVKKLGSRLSKRFSSGRPRRAVPEEAAEAVPSNEVAAWGPAPLFLEQGGAGGVAGKLKDRGVVALVARYGHGFAVTADGQVYGSGNNEEGQVEPSRGNDAFADGPLLVTESIFSNKRVAQVAVGQSHSAFLTAEGFVVTYGQNEFGQLGHSRDREPYRVPPRIVQKLGREVAIQVACSQHSTFILSSQGKVFSFGLGRKGVLGLGDESNRSEPKLIGGSLAGNPIAQISAGSEHCAAVSVTGRVYAWGSNESKQLGLQGEALYTSPTRVPLEKMVRAVACGDAHTVFLSITGKTYGCGNNEHGQLGTRDKKLIVPPRSLTGVQELGPAVQVAASESLSLVLTRAGTLYAFGGTRGPRTAPRALEVGEGVAPIAACTDGANVYALTAPDGLDEERRKEAARMLTAAPVQGVDAATLRQRAVALTAMRKGLSKRKSLRTLRRDIDLRFFDMFTMNASFLKGQLANNSNQDRIDEKRNSCVDVRAMVESFDSLYKALSGAMGEDAARMFLRERIAPLVAQLDEVAGSVVEPDQLRAFLVLLLIPFSHAIRKEHELLVLSLSRLPKRSRDILFSWIKYDVPSDIFLNNLIRPVLRLLDNLLVYHRFDEACEFFCKLLAQCAKINQSRRKALKPGFDQLRYTEFYSEQLAALRDEDLGRLFDRWRKTLQARKTIQETQRTFGNAGTDPQLLSLAKSFTIFDYPFLLSADAKRKVLQFEDQQSMFRNLLFSQLFRNSPYFNLEVRRDHLLEDTILKLSQVDHQELKKPLRVKFAGEDGLDAGGVKKEFFQLLSAQLFSPEYGMFVEYESTNTIWFRSLPEDMQLERTEFLMVGALIGLAIYNSTLLDVNFPLAMYRLLLQKMPKSPGLEELAELDPAYARNLNTMLEYEEDDFEDVFCQTFEISRETLDQRETIPLKPNGGDIPVTRDNVNEYIELLCRFLLVDSVSPFASPLVAGFNIVIPTNLASLSLFEPGELELAATGSPDLDFDDLEYVTTYEGGYTASHPTIQAFWRVAKSLTPEEKQQFMSFATGSPKAPVGGLKTTHFKIQRAGPDSDRLVSSSTCFNTLLLPDYGNEEKLRSKLLVSIEHNQGFGNE